MTNILNENKQQKKQDLMHCYLDRLHVGIFPYITCVMWATHTY